MSTETKGTRGGESMSREQRCLPGKCIPKYEPNAGNTYCTVCLCWLHKGPPAGDSGAPEKPTRTCSQCQDYGFVKGQDERLQPCPLCKPAGDSPSAPHPQCQQPTEYALTPFHVYLCELPKGHDGKCQPGGNCLKHGPFVGTTTCPKWPDCIPLPATSRTAPERRPPDLVIRAIQRIEHALSAKFSRVDVEAIERILYEEVTQPFAQRVAAPEPRRTCATCQSDDPKYELFFVYGEPEPRKGLWNQCQDSFHRGVAAPEGETPDVPTVKMLVEAVKHRSNSAPIRVILDGKSLIIDEITGNWSSLDILVSDERTSPQGTPKK